MPSITIQRCSHDGGTLPIRRSSQADLTNLLIHIFSRRTSFQTNQNESADLHFIPLPCFGRVRVGEIRTLPRVGFFTVLDGDVCGGMEWLRDRLCCKPSSNSLSSPLLCLGMQPITRLTVLSTEAPCFEPRWYPTIRNQLHFTRVVAPQAAPDLSVVAVPYPTSEAWDGKALPDAPPLSERRAIVALFASTQGLHNRGAEPLRAALEQECKSAQPGSCLMINKSYGVTSRQRLHTERSPGAAASFRPLAEALRAYRKAIWCLQPWGDTATRKGFWDAISVGCIPVTFTSAAWNTSIYHSWLGAAVDELSVHVPLAAVQYGVLPYLRAIPQGRLARLHARVLAARGRAQYSLFDNTPGGDAATILAHRVLQDIRYKQGASGTLSEASFVSTACASRPPWTLNTQGTIEAPSVYLSQMKEDIYRLFR